MKKTDVFLAINNLHGGGAEQVVLQLAKHWKGAGTAKILVAEKKGELLREVPDDIEVIEVGVPLALSNTMSFVRRLQEIFADHQPSAIISHMTAMNRMLLRARVLGALPRPLIVVEHNNAKRNAMRAGLSLALMRIETSLLYRRADALVGVSQGVLDSVRKHFYLPKKQGQVIHNPIDVRAIKKRSKRRPEEPLAEQIETVNRPLYLGVGRLVLQKDFATMLAAFSKLPEGRRGTLLILGEGPLRTDLETLIAELDLEGQVLMPGFVQNPWWYMAQADLFVLSSQWEGYPTVLIEAMASGTPFLATNCPYGPSEMIEAFQSGTLVDMNDPVSMAAQMQELVQNPVPLPIDDAFDIVAPCRSADAYASLVTGRHLTDDVAFKHTKDV